MIALGLLCAVPVIMWLVQSAQLRAAGLPVRWRIIPRGAPAHVKTAGRVVTQACLLGTILVYPLCIDRPIGSYYASLLPGRAAPQFLQGAACSLLLLALLFLAWLLTDQLRVDIHHSRRKWIRRLALLLPTALFGAFVEEFLFRGVVLADLLRSPLPGRGPAICIGAAVFAIAHYVRSVKRRWTFPGHVALGLLLCYTFAETGNLWLAAGIHAGGIFAIMGARPFVRYRGPAWLTGASIFPFAGVPGVVGLCLLAMFVARRYGGS